MEIKAESNETLVDIRQKHLNKMRDLQLKRNEARKINLAEVAEESRLAKLPPNWEAKQKRHEWLVKDEKLRQECEEIGVEIERVKFLETSVEDIERFDRKKKRKCPNIDYVDFDKSSGQKYSKLVSHMWKDESAYNKQKEALGDSFYANGGTLGLTEVVDSEEAKDGLVSDLQNQIRVREKHSRRRENNTIIDYINKKNMRFNKKLEYFYGKYTAEIKQNLERGTAL